MEKLTLISDLYASDSDVSDSGESGSTKEQNRDRVNGTESPPSETVTEQKTENEKVEQDKEFDIGAKYELFREVNYQAEDMDLDEEDSSVPSEKNDIITVNDAQDLSEDVIHEHAVKSLPVLENENDIDRDIELRVISNQDKLMSGDGRDSHSPFANIRSHDSNFSDSGNEGVTIRKSGTKRKSKRKLISLVHGYESDEDLELDVDSDESENVGYEENEHFFVLYDASTTGENLNSDDDALIPMEPEERCSSKLEQHIADLYQRMLRSGKDMNASIQNSKDFRNPSIYEKLISHLGIDEYGTNFPPHIYDPTSWHPESFYDELSKQQRIAMEKWEKQRKEKSKSESAVSGMKNDDFQGKQRKTRFTDITVTQKPIIQKSVNNSDVA